MRTRHITSTIADTQTTGGAVDLAAGSEDTMAVAAIFVPAAFNQTSITFEASNDDGTTWYDVLNPDGTALTYTVTGSTAECIAVPPTDLCGFSRLRPVAGGAVNANVTLTFVARYV